MSNLPAVESIQDSRVMAFGNQLVNSSFPVGARNVQVFAPQTSDLAQNGNSTWRALTDVNQGIDLSQCYMNTTFKVTQDAAGTAPITQPELKVFISENTGRLWKSGSISLSSQILENNTDIATLTDYKLGKWGMDACKTVLSDCLLQPIDGAANKGWPLPALVTAGNNAQPAYFYINTIVDANRFVCERARQLTTTDISGAVATEITVRQPLSFLFGLAELPQIIPSTTVELTLQRAEDRAFCVAGKQGLTAYVTVSKAELVFISYSLTKEAKAALDSVKTILAPHYRHYIQPITAPNTSFQIPAFAGFESVGIRFRRAGAGPIVTGTDTKWVCDWLSTPPVDDGTLNLTVNYKGKNYPSGFSQMSLKKYVDPSAALGGYVQWLNKVNPGVYYEMYSSDKGNAYRGIGASETVGSRYSLYDWLSAHMQLEFSFLADQSPSPDNQAGSVTIEFNASSLGGNPATSVNEPVPATTHSIVAVFTRTNQIKYDSSTRVYSLVNNGPS